MSITQHAPNSWALVPPLTALLAIACADGRGPRSSSAEREGPVPSQAHEWTGDGAEAHGHPKARESSERGREASAPPTGTPEEDAMLDPEPDAQAQRAGASDAGSEHDPKAEPTSESDPDAYAYRACSLPTGLIRAAIIARRDAPPECIRVVLVEKGDSVPALSDELGGSGIDMPTEWAIESAVRSTQLEACTALGQLPTALEARTGSGSLSIREQSGTFRIEADFALDFIDGATTHRVSLRFDDLAVSAGPETCG